MSFWKKLFGGSKRADRSAQDRISNDLGAILRMSADLAQKDDMSEDDAVNLIVSSMRARTAAKVNSTFETGEKNPQRILCSDNEGPCSGTEPLVIGKTAYLYISQQVVDFRMDCLSLVERDVKLQTAARSVGANALLVDGGVANPFYLCEKCAKARGLDLIVALADAETVAETGFAPLRATPKRSA
jgi:hypothetical protein